MPQSSPVVAKTARAKLQVIRSRADSPREVARSIYESIKLCFAPRTVFRRAGVDAYDAAGLLVEESEERIRRAKDDAFRAGQRSMLCPPPPGARRAA